MDREAWWAAVHRVTRDGHGTATKPPAKIDYLINLAGTFSLLKKIKTLFLFKLDYKIKLFIYLTIIYMQMRIV